jgi:hypothetical protein
LRIAENTASVNMGIMRIAEVVYRLVVSCVEEGKNQDCIDKSRPANLEAAIQPQSSLMMRRKLLIHLAYPSL